MGIRSIRDSFAVVFLIFRPILRGAWNDFLFIFDWDDILL